MRKLVRFLEVFAYFSPAHAYSLQVSFLGLFPILMSSNEPLIQEAIARLESGGLFAFGVSEKAHGSDLFANEFTVTPTDAGGWLADGAKYYIGNVNAACIVSILAKKGSRAGQHVEASAVCLLRAPASENRRRFRTCARSARWAFARLSWVSSR